MPDNFAAPPEARASRTRLMMIGAGILVLLLVTGGVIAYQKTSSNGQTGILGRVIGFTPDGTLVTGTSEGGAQIRFWNMNTAEETRSPINLPFSGGTAMSNDGQAVAVASAGCASHIAPCPKELSEAGGPGSRVRLYSVATGQQTCVIEQTNDSPYNVVFAADGKVVALSGFEGSASLWDATSCQQIARLRSPTNANVTVVATSPDGNTLAGGGTSPYVDLWNVTTHELEHRISTNQTGNMMDMAFSPDGRLLATTANDGTLRLWDTTTLEETIPPIRAGDNSTMPTVIRTIAFNPDRTMIAGLGPSNGVLLWDTRTGQARTSPAALAKFEVVDVAFSPDGTTILATHPGKDEFSVVAARL